MEAGIQPVGLDPPFIYSRQLNPLLTSEARDAHLNYEILPKCPKVNDPTQNSALSGSAWDPDGPVEATSLGYPTMTLNKHYLHATFLSYQPRKVFTQSTTMTQAELQYVTVLVDFNMQLLLGLYPQIGAKYFGTTS